MAENIDEPKRPRNREGRPKKYDWDNLFKEFVDSGKTKAAFLRGKGIAPNPLQARDWNTHLWKSKVAIQNTIAERDREAPEHYVDLLALVQQWSRGLAVKHFKPAELALIHIELLLQKGFTTDAQGVTGTKLAPRELRALIAAAADCQKIQRLALGLSTENVALPPPQAPQDPEKNVSPSEQTGPVFVVEVNQNGKFLRPRPRLTAGQIPEANTLEIKPDEPKE